MKNKNELNYKNLKISFVPTVTTSQTHEELDKKEELKL